MVMGENKAVFRTMRNGVVLLSVALLLMLFVSCASGQKDQIPQVLLILRENIGSVDKEHMTTNEAIMMKSMLEEAGFKVVTASASVRTFVHGDITLESNLQLAEVNVADYVGFIFPCCMGIGTASVKPEEVAIAKQAVAAGKPVAAQRKGVVILSRAGVLEGKRHAYSTGKGIYIGEGVVQDGNIITSTYCPGAADYYSKDDGTSQLTRLFIEAIKD
jgi:putative intracellular protease/amidase